MFERTSKRIVRATASVLLATLLVGCSGIFFFPYRGHLQTPDQLGLAYEDIYLKTADDVKLHAWFLPAAGSVQGTVYYLHGNGENISTHIHNVRWLPDKGYNVLLLDYRGYGLSEGEAALPGALWDIKAGMQWLIKQRDVTDKPLYLLGQSLGASLAIYFAATDVQARQQLSGVVSDAAFTRYGDIVRHVAAGSWLTWLFQYPASWMVVKQYDPIDYIERIAPLPLLLIHSRDDEVVPYQYGEQLYRTAVSPKQFLTTRGFHGGTFNSANNRTTLLSFFDKNRGAVAAPLTRNQE
ncbi:MAG: alpha/beta hydrolase [Gammaproteobacteria bacterium]|nr:alpha/beta hydrolase [Gammaproteobacteria bacterium]